MCFQWHLHIISRQSITWGISLQLKVYPLSSCLTTDLLSTEKSLGSFPMTLTLFTPHHHPISISQMDSSRQWCRKSRTPTRRRMDPPMLRLKHCSSYMTHLSRQTSCPKQRFYMVVQHKVQSFQDHPRGSIYIRSRQRLVELQEKQKEQFNRAHRAKDLCPLKVKEQVQFFQNKQATGPIKWVTGTVVEILRMWTILHNPGPQWQSLQKESELIWSPYVTTAPPFKTIQWEKGEK